jgi:lysyl-tRNA synthetase class II
MFVHVAHESAPGRVRSRRSSGNKLFFYELIGDGVKIQILANAS